MITLRGTAWANIREPVGARFQSPWSEFVKRLELPRRVADKKLLPGWAPVTFRDNRRCLAGVEECTAVGLDIDRAPSFEEASEPWSALELAVHTTFSHRTALPRVRLILPLSRGVDAHTYARLWTWAAARATQFDGIVVDLAAKDPSRLWFAPGTSPDGEYRVQLQSGELLDVDRVLSTLSDGEEASPISRVRNEPIVTRREVIDRARNYLAKCEPAISGQGGSARTFVVAQMLVRGFCLSEYTALELLLEEYNPRCKPRWKYAELERKVHEAITAGRMEVGKFLNADELS